MRRSSNLQGSSRLIAFVGGVAEITPQTRGRLHPPHRDCAGQSWSSTSQPGPSGDVPANRKVHRLLHSRNAVFNVWFGLKLLALLLCEPSTSSSDLYSSHPSKDLRTTSTSRPLIYQKPQTRHLGAAQMLRNASRVRRGPSLSFRSAN